ncbi:MAG: methionyl-tRNA formyltransferase [Candidatus Falkowbacteria bacterium]|nr:methionyl-tRNA formyltransferase [Candidatus Falkowbacteria bacterium]
MKAIKTIFIGTPDFAIPSLKVLIADSDFAVVGVITKPDKPVGRKQIITPPPIKALALEHGLLVFQPEKIKEFVNEIKNLSPDLIVITAYSQIIPQSILDIPQYGCINVHGSLLPKYRGASCIQAAILNGDQETGVTIMKIDAGLDTGAILSQAKLAIESTWTGGDLYEKIAELGASILADTLKKYVNGEIVPVAQNDSAASYAGILKKEDGLIDWAWEAVRVERFVRAMQPWPGTFANFDGMRIKIIEVSGEILSLNDGEIVKLFVHNSNLSVQCGKDTLTIKRLQLEGKKIMNSQEFLNGHSRAVAK